MAEAKKPARDAIAALLAFAVDVDQTPTEAREELEEMGIDVEAFLTRVADRRAAASEEDRTAWLRAARARLKVEEREIPLRYRAMSRGELVAAYKQRQLEAQAFFHKLEDVSEDDLRTLLMDLDDLADGKKEST